MRDQVEDRVSGLDAGLPVSMIIGILHSARRSGAGMIRVVSDCTVYKALSSFMP